MVYKKCSECGEEHLAQTEDERLCRHCSFMLQLSTLRTEDVQDLLNSMSSIWPRKVVATVEAELEVRKLKAGTT